LRSLAAALLPPNDTKSVAALLQPCCTIGGIPVCFWGQDPRMLVKNKQHKNLSPISARGL
jgi:hypothetical protein